MAIQESYYITEELLAETTHVSFHRRTPTEMVRVHKSVLNSNGHNIVHHETTGDGSHVIHHLTPSKKVRTTIVSPITGKKGMNTKMTDKPASSENQKTYGVKM